MLLFRSKSLLTSRLSPGNPAFISSIYRLLVSTPPCHDNTSPSPASDFAVQYLISSCGLPPDKATKASRYLPHLKSPEKPDAVLGFLRQAGVSEPHIKAAVSQNPRLLFHSVEKCLKPKMVELQEIGFSPSDISFLLSVFPSVFRYAKLQQKVQFWLGILNSKEKLLGALNNNNYLLSTNLNTISANLSFLKVQYGLSSCQIAQLIKVAPRLILSTPQALKNKAKRAEELGIACSSGAFVYALKVVNGQNQSIVDARISNLRNIGFSQEEVTRFVSKFPLVLTIPEDIISLKMKFLTKEPDCDKKHLLSNPSLFSFSLEKRLIPRSLVRNVLKLEGLPVANKKIASFVLPAEKKFVEKFVMPYELAIPGFIRAYEAACAGNIGELERFKSNSS